MADRNDAKRTELAALNEARRVVHAFLSKAFSRPPSAEDLAVLRSDPSMRSVADMFSEPILASLHEFAAAAAGGGG